MQLSFCYLFKIAINVCVLMKQATMGLIYSTFIALNKDEGPTEVVAATPRLPAAPRPPPHPMRRPLKKIKELWKSKNN
ncbi:hypothetical protein HanIR_Chr12g0595621 [Helianthus annuus]|nr:hypothetical protein HanIR_Chr12g0595621 [Helianthus annuus]